MDNNGVIHAHFLVGDRRLLLLFAVRRMQLDSRAEQRFS
jgi:hypothetical protein